MDRGDLLSRDGRLIVSCILVALLRELLLGDIGTLENPIVVEISEDQKSSN